MRLRLRSCALISLLTTVIAILMLVATAINPGAAAHASGVVALQAATVPQCGAAVAKASGGYWTCSFDEEFSGVALDTTKWVAQQTANSAYHSGAECFVNRAANLSVANGYLSLTARKEAAPFVCKDPLGDYVTQYTSGSASTWGKFSQAYGRFEVRAKLPAATVKGLQESLWLWPADAYKYGPVWPISGEIDIAEIYSQYPDRAIPYIHYVAGVLDPNITNNYCLISTIAQFHSYVVEWTPTAITVIYDGHTCLVDRWAAALPLTGLQPFDQPFLVALTQALGIYSNAFDPATTPLPATTQIDYVHVWK